MVWCSHLLKNFPQFVVIHTIKGFGIVNKTEVDVFLKLSCFFDYPADVGNLISGSSAFSKTSFYIWKFTVHILLKPGLENLGHYFASMWDECSCAVVWAFFGIAFLWDWNENRPFPVLWPLLSFPNLRLGIIRKLCLPRWLSGKESTCQSAFRRPWRHGFNPWVGKSSLKKEIATCSSVLAWEFPRTEEPGGLQSVGSQWVGHDWATEHTHLKPTLIEKSL